jgi:ABC-type transport system involved in multi-copper enzyme maturation permease subunit
MEIVKILENIDKLTKDGVPLNVNVEKTTLQTTGTYLIAGFAVSGLVTGLVIAAALWYFKKK